MKDERVAAAAPAPQRRGARNAGVARPTPRPIITYDEPLVAAVKTFQESLGLTADGVIGPGDGRRAQRRRRRSPRTTSSPTWNAGAGARRLRRLPRLREHPRIPRSSIMATDGEVAYTTRVVIGTPTQPDPGLLRRDRAHRRQSVLERAVLDRHQRDRAAPAAPTPATSPARTWRCCPAARSINASAIDWSHDQHQQLPHPAAPGRRQCAGPDQVPVPQPARRLSARHAVQVAVRRAPSAPTATAACACRTRWSSPMRCSSHEPELTARVARRRVRRQRDAGSTSRHHIPVHLTYFTLRVDADGTIRSYGDVYGHNKRLIELLDRVARPAPNRRRPSKRRPPAGIAALSPAAWQPARAKRLRLLSNLALVQPRFLA